MQIGKYSFGVGDRFGLQGEAQLSAFIEAEKKGLEITPVWNKSAREHNTIGSVPADTRASANNAVEALDWKKPWFVDADHINMSNADRFTESSDFFTIDVADSIGKQPSEGDLDMFLGENLKYTGDFFIPGISESFSLTRDQIFATGKKYLFAVKQAAEIYRHIESSKGRGNFITEISMDEVAEPQTPLEIFFILSALAYEKVPVQTIAPKFSGRFNKGVDYQGNTEVFRREFEQDLMVIDLAVKEFGLPENLKLSIHSGSDKFSIYPLMSQLIKDYDKGIHVKTAGTTWLEEIIGLALAGGEALDLAKDIYFAAIERFDELCGPYMTVIDINKRELPALSTVLKWTSDQFAAALRHEPGHPGYRPDMRQLVHVAYKIAAEYGTTYTDLVKEHKEVIGRQVTENIYTRHFGRLFDL